MNLEEQRYLTQDIRYDPQDDDTLIELRILFARYVRHILDDGLQGFRILLPGKYGRITGAFIFTGTSKGFTYELKVKIKEADDETT